MKSRNIICSLFFLGFDPKNRKEEKIIGCVCSYEKKVIRFVCPTYFSSLFSNFCKLFASQFLRIRQKIHLIEFKSEGPHYEQEKSNLSFLSESSVNFVIFISILAMARATFATSLSTMVGYGGGIKIIDADWQSIILRW